ncbi:MAG: hypothetical protein ACLFVQ_14325 [Chitinispirillaceae bacterium]
MRCGLFESLTGHFLDGTPAENLSGQEALVRSIRDNLFRVLNTRSHISQQSRSPALIDMQHNLPCNSAEAQRVITRLVSDFEPRLKNVAVTFIPSGINNSAFLISGENRQSGTLRFKVTFEPSEMVILKPIKDDTP